MKKFMEPEIEVLKFAIEDVITASSGTPSGGGVPDAGEDDWV